MMAELAALGAALCWALGSLFAASATRQLGAIPFTRLRMVMVFCMLLVALLVNGSGTVASADWGLLILSGFVGIFIGDTALFLTLSRLGPRRTGILFSCNAPMTVFLAWWILDEQMRHPAILGSVLVASGVFVAIVHGKRRNQLHVWEEVRGSLRVGIGIGLLAALGQATGSLMVAPALANGTDPLTVATVRIGSALLAFYLARIAFPRQTRCQQPLTIELSLRMFASGFLGMAAGMTLLLYAFAHGSIGLSAALSSTTPVMMIPILWIVSRERPALGAWIGALLAVIGSCLIVLYR